MRTGIFSRNMPFLSVLIMIGIKAKGRLILVPAAAVIHEARPLFLFTGRKTLVDGSLDILRNPLLKELSVLGV